MLARLIAWRTSVSRRWWRTLRCAALAGLWVGAAAEAHDLWIVPGRFQLKPGEKTSVFINAGDRFPESQALLAGERIASYLLHTTTGETAVSELRADGKSLVSEVSAGEAGTAILSLGLKPSVVRLTAEHFNEYLAQDGLPQVLRLRAELGEANQPVFERYVKWAKAILKIGELDDEFWSQPLGVKIEIVPERRPVGLRAGDELPVRVFYEGAPLAGVVVLGGRAGRPPSELRGWTDAEGRVSFALSAAGRFYLHAVHMTRLSEDKEAQWESFWATLTFECGS